MADLASPLGDAWHPGSRALRGGSPGVTLSETERGSIVQVAAWPDTLAAIVEAIRGATGLTVGTAPGAGALGGSAIVFGIGPGRFLLASDAEGLAESLSQAIAPTTGSVTDLSHGRVALRIAGPKAEWVLAKFFAVDFSLAAFPVGQGIATMHHDILAAIQRSAPETFDLYVFRSFARSFWTALCHASEEVGYEIA